MLASFIQRFLEAVVNFIAGLGYWGIGIGMAIESANIPLPSEIILPFGGFLVSQGKLDFWGAVMAGTVGGTVGSALSYALGWWGGRPFLLRYGRYILVTEARLSQADRWFARYGDAAVFIARLLPVVRTFISFPAGIAGMHFGRFLAYTFLGSFPWCLFLTYLGVKLGENWRALQPLFHRLDILIVAVLLGLVLYAWWHRRQK
ncbi:MAG: DedA family protein [Bacillota bacterium]